ncbi:hypothetical protein DV736_g5589, partial [Chaetothyriales sp. CBS 134916]
PHALTNSEIVGFCQLHKDDRSRLLSPDESGTKVIKLTDQVVVKFGRSVRLQEASAQDLAFKNTDCEVLRIPKVYRFFSQQESKWDSVGYLVMEKIDGVNLEQLGDWDKAEIVSRVTTVLNALHSIPGTCPGPISGGEAYGYLYAQKSSGTEFSTINDLESYLNERLAFFERKISLGGQHLCLCHMDVAPRNFIMDVYGRLCLLDWATAGFYPRYFELWSLEFADTCSSHQFGPVLLQSLKATAAETMEIENLNLVYRFNMRCRTKAYDEQTEEIMAAIGKTSKDESYS